MVAAHQLAVRFADAGAIGNLAVGKADQDVFGGYAGATATFRLEDGCDSINERAEVASPITKV